MFAVKFPCCHVVCTGLKITVLNTFFDERLFKLVKKFQPYPFSSMFNCNVQCIYTANSCFIKILN